MYFFYLALLLLLYMCFWYVISLFTNRNDVADIAWGLGFILMAWASFGMSLSDGVLQVALNILVTLWGLRLCFHVFQRNAGKTEDERYAKWRKEWGSLVYVRSFFQIFLLQGVILYLIALPVIILNYESGSSLIVLEIIGFFLWAVGFIIESFSDWQLAEFKSDSSNQGQILQTGLWAYSRHPNYFGEMLVWWGIAIIAIGTPYGWIGLIGPILLTFLLLFVSGIPMLEKKYENHSGYQAYKEKTSMIFPLPQRGRHPPPTAPEE